MSMLLIISHGPFETLPIWEKAAFTENFAILFPSLELV